MFINQVLLHSQRPLLEHLDPAWGLQADLGLDSLELAELTVRIEAHFGIDVFADSTPQNVGDLLKKLP